MQKIIIGLVGELAAGKGTIVKYLEEKYGAASYRFSTPLRDVLERLHLEINRKNMQDVSRILREYFGQNLLAKTIAEDAKNDSNKVIAVDGVRRPADIEYLSKLPEFKLVYITADVKIRYERLLKRGENAGDKNKTFEQFLRDHEAETEILIPKIGKEADYKIDNNGTLEKLYEQIDEIISNI
ncbi:AAA family ATPase [Candidatus Falkowbacteria bacterium]|nr:AAA family ATPase [Candidatus Falkowbacteria bacterium]